MNFEEFLVDLKKKKFDFDPDYGAEYHKRWGSKTAKSNLKKSGRPTMYVKWVTGGVGGGNCYSESDEDNYPVEPEEEPDFEIFDDLISCLWGDISFLQYKKLKKELVKYDTEQEFEYYGNHTNYGIRYVVLEDLYKYLKELGKV